MQRLADFIVRAQKIRAAIELERNTIEHWNRINPHEEPITMDYSEVERELDKTLAKILAKSEGKSA